MAGGLKIFLLVGLVGGRELNGYFYKVGSFSNVKVGYLSK